MHDTHLVESLHIDIAFENMLVCPGDGEDAQVCLATFLRGKAVEVLDAVFDAALPTQDVWRIDRLDVDLGRLLIDDTQDWRDQWTRALRTRLGRLLDDLRDAPLDPAGDGEARHPVHRRHSQLQMLLFFLRHGRMPWYGRGRRGEDPLTLAGEVLQHRPRELAAALRESGERPRLLQRLAAQFDHAWLAELLRAMFPTEPTAVARLLDVIQRAQRPGRADDDASTTRLWEAVLEQAFSEGSTPHRSDVAVTRLQLQMALESETDSLALDDPLRGTAPAWRRLLHDDRVWLKETLQRLGRTQSLERRLVRTLDADLLPELASLWLAPAQSAAMRGWISAAAADAPTSELHEHDMRRELWEAALSHFLSGGGDAGFDGRRIARRALRRAPSTARPTPTAVPAAPPPMVEWLRAGPAWWALLRDEADTLRSAVRQHVRRGRSACRQLVRDWSEDMLLEAACLQAPQARQLIAAAVGSPPLDAATRERRWACTLQYVYARERAASVDERAYLACLAHDTARAEGRSLSQVVTRWSAAVLSVDAAPTWFDRIDEVRGHPIPVAPSPAHGDVPRAPQVSGRPPGPVDTELAQAAAARPEGDTPSPALRPAGARSLAVRVVAALAAFAGRLGRQVARVLVPAVPARANGVSAADAGDQSLGMSIDNAGLVLIGPYLPRLFEALGLLVDEKFVDARAREHALHLMQYAVNGLDKAAPESQLVLNKVLCGLDLGACVGRRFRISSEAQTLIDGLLDAVIAHWSILGKTTLAGLRETFLQRRGWLQRRPEGGWTLTVEPGSFDILLDRLPWGYAMQKHPWMNEVIHVEWR